MTVLGDVDQGQVTVMEIPLRRGTVMRYYCTHLRTIVGIKATVLPLARIMREYRRMSSLLVNTRVSTMVSWSIRVFND